MTSLTELRFFGMEEAVPVQHVRSSFGIQMQPYALHHDSTAGCHIRRKTDWRNCEVL
jgi:hypothetical protein